MGFFQNPIQGPDPLGSFRVEKIEEDKLTQNENKGDSNKPPEEEPGLIAFILQTFSELIDFFLEPKKPQISAKGLKEELLQLKKAFETLKTEDRSQDTPFLAALIQVWQKILEKNLYLNIPQLNALIKSVQSYPEKKTHTLGYYLSEYADQNWIPFPYMELIQKIHKDHELYGGESSLSKWSSLIDEITDLLILNQD